MSKILTMVLASTFTYALYAPSAWAKCASPCAMSCPIRWPR